MQRVLVLGASGGIGRHVVSEGLRRGLDVTAAVRDPRALAALPGTDGARVARVDVFDPGGVAAAVPGHEAVISALGSRTPRRADPVTSTAARHVVEAMEAHGVRRLLAVSSVGMGDPAEYGPLVRGLVIGLLFRRGAPHAYADVNAMEDRVRASGLDWTLVRPTTLTDGPRTGRAVPATDSRRGVRVAVSRADVAAFLLDQLDDPTYSRAVVELGRGPRLALRRPRG